MRSVQERTRIACSVRGGRAGPGMVQWPDYANPQNITCRQRAADRFRTGARRLVRSVWDPGVERARYFALALLCASSLLVSSIALALLFPLKTVVPYVMERAENGAVTPVPATAQRYSPGAAEKRYFIAQWVKKLLTLDRYFSEPYLSEAYLLTRAKATTEFTDWLRKNAPIADLQKDPSLTRTISISSVSLLQEEVALVRLATEKRSMSNPSAVREKFVVTLHFAVVPPKTEEDLYKNPIG